MLLDFDLVPLNDGPFIGLALRADERVILIVPVKLDEMLTLAVRLRELYEEEFLDQRLGKRQEETEGKSE
jgi:hypothetical protein